MKKILSVLLTISMIFALFGSFTIGYADDFSMTMQIGNPTMMVDGAEKPIDDEGSVPVIVNERTLLPVRTVVEEMGGMVDWEADTRTAVLNYGDKEIRLVIDSKTAYLNGSSTELDTAPEIINGRTMLPIRFIAESFGFAVEWDGDTQTVTISKTANSTETAMPTGTPEADESNAIVVYFSRAGEQYGVGVVEKGNTAVIADMIIDATGADKFEILPKEDNYPKTYYELTEVAKEEQNNNARPELASRIENFDKCDTVFLGYPIWWGDLPMIVYTFLESYDFDGKTVIPFCTHAGSGLSGTVINIKKALPNAYVKDGLAIAGTDAQNNKDEVKRSVGEWLKGMGFADKWGLNIGEE